MVMDSSELPPPKKEIWKDHEKNLWNLSIEFLVPLEKDKVFHIIADPDVSTRVFSNFKGYGDLQMQEEDKEKGELSFVVAERICRNETLPFCPLNFMYNFLTASLFLCLQFCSIVWLLCDV